jgi:hypothetical protein
MKIESRHSQIIKLEAHILEAASARLTRDCQPAEHERFDIRTAGAYGSAKLTGN